MDVELGQRLVELFRPFVDHLRAPGMAPRTIRRHMDNLWLLGGELVRRAQHDRRLRRSPKEALLVYGEAGEAPLIWNATERVQKEVDATLRALFRHMDIGDRSFEVAPRRRLRRP